MKININKGMILNIASNSDVYARGESYFNNGKVKEISFHIDKSSKIVEAIVSGNYKSYSVHLLFDSTDKLTGYKCTCESHSIWRGACKHVVATLLASSLNNPQDIEKARMIAAAKNVADAFEKQIFQEIDSTFEADKDGRIFLLPILHISSESSDVQLECTIGESRSYNVKNLNELLSNIQNNTVFSYGKKLTFCHSYSSFDTDARQLIKFLERENSMYTAVSKSLLKRFGYYAYSRDATRYMFLTSYNLDDFFSLYLGKTLQVRIDHKETETLQCVRRLPEFNFDLDCQDGKIVIEGQPTDFISLEGENYIYLICNNILFRLSKGLGEMLTSLLKSINTMSGSIIFTGKEADRFMTVIYPALKKNGLLGKVTGDFEMLQQVDMQAKLYFDSLGNDIDCLVLFVYGNEEINPIVPYSGNCLRDIAEEYKTLRTLNSLGFRENNEKSTFILKGDELIYDFLHRDIKSLFKSADVYVTDELRKKEIKKAPRQFGVRISGNLLEMTADDSDFNLHDLLEAMDSYHAKRKFHRLKDGRFIPLDSEEIQSAAELVSALDLTKKDVHDQTITLPKYKALYLDALTQNNHNVVKDDNFSKLTGDIGHFQDASYPVPDILNDVLRVYQKTGFAWLKTLSHYGFGGILADDMGLGKTIQVIALLLSAKLEAQAFQTSLVVAPTSLIYNWEKEIARFAPMLSTRVISGPVSRRREMLSDMEVDVLITTYDMLKRDLNHYLQLDRDFAYVIADEAQFIKNPLTQNAKAVKSIKGCIRFALTGTPMENGLLELWSIFDFVLPGYLHSQSKFTRLYETPIVKNEDISTAKRLQKQTAPFILRRIKTDVLKELPEKTETTLYAEMLSDQKKLYLVNLLKARGELEQVIDEGIYAKSQIKILAQLTRLRQICCHPSLYVDNYTGGSGKLDLAIETIQRSVESGHRLLLFSQFTSMLRIIKNVLDKIGITYFYLDGATDSKQRNEMMNHFNDGENDCFLISLKAGGTGLNLTGADVVIHYDPWWNPAVMDQASDRAHRYGQQKVVQVFNLVMKDSIEEKILTLQNKKRDLIDSVITDNTSFISKLSPEDVKDLFNDSLN